MIKFNKKHFVVIPIMFFIFARMVYADLEITEIMYDLSGTDSNREWFEVHNIGKESVDLSKWYLFSDNSKHKLVPQGSSLVPSDGYAIIVQNVIKFKADWPNFSGLIFDSSWTGFNNISENIALKDSNLNIISSVTYNSSQGGSGDGNSLQLVNGLWVGLSPTPGIKNQETKIINKIIDSNLNPNKEVDLSGQIATSNYKNNIPIIENPKVKSLSVNSPKKNISKNIQTKNIPEIVNLNNLVASADKADTSLGMNYRIYSWLGLGSIIVIGAVVIILFRRKKEYPDYKEDDLSARDITIIE